jgi:hypothetical protein
MTDCAFIEEGDKLRAIALVPSVSRFSFILQSHAICVTKLPVFQLGLLLKTQDISNLSLRRNVGIARIIRSRISEFPPKSFRNANYF